MKLTEGMKMPVFTVNTSSFDNVSLKEIMGEKNIFWVIRYIGCTVCRYDVHLLAKQYEKIAEKGYTLFVVMQSDTEHVRRELENADVPFEIICDNGFEIYNTLEVYPAESREQLVGDQLDKLKAKGAAAREAGFAHGDYEGNELQLPALFITDKDGTVKYAHYGKNIVDMPTVEELIEIL